MNRIFSTLNLAAFALFLGSGMAIAAPGELNWSAQPVAVTPEFSIFDEISVDQRIQAIRGQQVRPQDVNIALWLEVPSSPIMSPGKKGMADAIMTRVFVNCADHTITPEFAAYLKGNGRGWRVIEDSQLIEREEFNLLDDSQVISAVSRPEYMPAITEKCRDVGYPGY